MTKIPSLKLPDPPAPLRIGLIAGADASRALRSALSATPDVSLTTQGGLPQTSVSPPIEWFDDLRVLIAQGPVDALVLNVSPRMSVELVVLAVERGRHVWQPPPLARNFSEAVETVRRTRGSEVIYRVGSWWEHVRPAVQGTIASDEAAVAPPERRDEIRRPILSHVAVSAAGPNLVRDASHDAQPCPTLGPARGAVAAIKF